MAAVGATKMAFRLKPSPRNVDGGRQQLDNHHNGKEAQFTAEVNEWMERIGDVAFKQTMAVIFLNDELHKYDEEVWSRFLSSLGVKDIDGVQLISSKCKTRGTDNRLLCAIEELRKTAAPTWSSVLQSLLKCKLWEIIRLLLESTYLNEVAQENCSHVAQENCSLKVPMEGSLSSVDTETVCFIDSAIGRTSSFSSIGSTLSKQELRLNCNERCKELESMLEQDRENNAPSASNRLFSPHLLDVNYSLPLGNDVYSQLSFNLISSPDKRVPLFARNSNHFATWEHDNVERISSRQVQQFANDNNNSTAVIASCNEEIKRRDSVGLVLLTYSPQDELVADEVMRRLKKQNVEAVSMSQINDYFGKFSLNDRLERVAKEVDCYVPILSKDYFRLIDDRDLNNDSNNVLSIYQQYTNEYQLNGNINERVYALRMKEIQLRDLKNRSVCLHQAREIFSEYDKFQSNLLYELQKKRNENRPEE